jgi:hypothetical protein
MIATGLVVGCADPPAGSTLTATAANDCAIAGISIVVVEPRATLNVTDGLTPFAPFAIVQA